MANVNGLPVEIALMHNQTVVWHLHAQRQRFRFFSFRVGALAAESRLPMSDKGGVKPRLKEAVTRGWISEQEGMSLEQLWDRRNNVHLKVLENSEHDIYQVEHVNAPHAALYNLMVKSKAWHAERQKVATKLR
jgi:hypothetical protein